MIRYAVKNLQLRDILIKKNSYATIILWIE